jgi:hypothetical protein
MRKVVTTALGAIITIGLFAASAQAQATRTWVSGVGDDVNPCSRTAPCKTFAGAISKTAAGGEISVLDPGGFGAVTITKSITLNGYAQIAGILAAGTNGIIVNALSTDKVVLRNLSIVGAITGVNGIRYLSAAQVIVDHCTIEGFLSGTGRGIDMSTTDVAGTGFKKLVVLDSVISNNLAGIRIADTSLDDFDLVEISNTSIVNNTGIGVEGAQGGIRISMIHSNVSNNGTDGVKANSAGTQANLDSNMLSANNGTAINSAVSGARIRIADNTIVNNTTSIAIAAGAFVESTSPASNRVAGNGGGAAPNATYTQQ